MSEDAVAFLEGLPAEEREYLLMCWQIGVTAEHWERALAWWRERRDG